MSSTGLDPCFGLRCGMTPPSPASHRRRSSIQNPDGCPRRRVRRVATAQEPVQRPLRRHHDWVMLHRGMQHPLNFGPTRLREEIGVLAHAKDLEDAFAQRSQCPTRTTHSRRDRATRARVPASGRVRGQPARTVPGRRERNRRRGTGPETESARCPLPGRQNRERHVVPRRAWNARCPAQKTQPGLHRS